MWVFPALCHNVPVILFIQRDEQVVRLQQMFEQKYEGNAVESFIHGLDVYSDLYEPARHYGHCIALLQSSGTGKSRLVYELGKMVCITRLLLPD